jgi:hypothetical protein
MATRKKSSGSGKKTSRRSSSKKKAGKKVQRSMREMQSGTLRAGRSRKKVRSRKQAIAIGLSEARREGADVPPRKKSAKKGARKRSAKRGSAGRASR